MAKIDKLIARFLSNPKDLEWNELCTILSHYGYSEHTGGKTGGSRRRFVDADKTIIWLHKPHPGTIVKHYQIKEVIAHLKERGRIKNE